MQGARLGRSDDSDNECVANPVPVVSKRHVMHVKLIDAHLQKCIAQHASTVSLRMTTWGGLAAWQTGDARCSHIMCAVCAQVAALAAQLEERARGFSARLEAMHTAPAQPGSIIEPIRALSARMAAASLGRSEESRASRARREANRLTAASRNALVTAATSHTDARAPNAAAQGEPMDQAPAASNLAAQVAVSVPGATQQWLCIV